MKVKKYFLNQIIRFSFISKNPSADISHALGMPPKKHGKSLAVACTDVSQQSFVGKLSQTGSALRFDPQASLSL
jgi:hypothetical protein